MIKQSNNGFSVVEGLLIFVLVTIVGGAAYYVYHSNQKTTETLNSIGKSDTPANVTQKTDNQSKPDESVSKESDNKASEPNEPSKPSEPIISVIDAYKYSPTDNPNERDVVVDMSITNSGSEDFILTLSKFILADSGNNTGANGGSGVGTTMDNGYKIIGEQILKPGQKITGAMRFNILNPNYSIFTLKYYDQSFTLTAN